MATQRYGRYVTSPEQDIGQIGSGDQRAIVFDALSQTLIVYQLGGWIGKFSGSPRARIGIGGVSGSTPDPGARLAYTAELNPSATYTDITGGAAYVGDVTPFIASPGRYSLVLTARDGVISHSMRAAAAISADNRNFYDKSGLGSTVPTDPIGGSPSYNGHVSLWAVGMVNEAPDVPINRTPSGTLVDGNLTPSLAADFNDANEVLPNGVNWDYVNQVQVQVRQVGTTTLKWDRTYTASSGERAADRTSVVYAGSSLSFGVNYEWRIRHSDRAGAWSSWSSWLGFSLAAAGAVAQPTSPTGKLTTLTPTSFIAKWTSQTALSTNAVQVRLMVGNVIVATSPTIAKTVANNGNITITWAESAFSALTWATPYTVQIRGRDTGNVWSDWSPAKAFSTNAAPAIPSNLTPASGTVTTALPKLRAKASDPDGDTVTVKFRVKNNSGTVLFTRTATNLGGGNYEYQCTSTDMATFATYRIDAYSYDGSLYSGATTVEASATTTSEVIVTYASGPVVTVTAPTPSQVFTTRTIALAWTVTDQQKRQVFFYDLLTNALVYTSNEVTTTTPSVVVYNADIHNGGAYYAVVKITNSLSLVGYSDPVSFSLAYVPAAPINGFVAFPVRLGTDADPTGVLMQWETTDYPASQFESYNLYRVPLDGIGGSVAGDRELIRSITNPLQNAFLDAEAASGKAYEYQLEQVVTVGLDQLTSTAATSQVALAFTGVILGNVKEPETYHVDLRYADQPDNEGDWEYGQDVVYVQSTGATKPRAIRGMLQTWNPSGAYKLITDHIATAAQRRQALKSLIERGGTMCIRDGHGEVKYVSLKTAKISNRRLYYVATLTFQEVDYVSGETGVAA